MTVTERVSMASAQENHTKFNIGSYNLLELKFEAIF